MNTDAQIVCYATDLRTPQPCARGVATLLLDLESLTPGMLITGGHGPDQVARYVAIPPEAAPMLEEMLAAVIDVFALSR